MAIVSTKDPAHFRTTPGGYFHGMVAKAKAGELNLDRTLWAHAAGERAAAGGQSGLTAVPGEGRRARGHGPGSDKAGQEKRKNGNRGYYKPPAPMLDKSALLDRLNQGRSASGFFSCHGCSRARDRLARPWPSQGSPSHAHATDPLDRPRLAGIPRRQPDPRRPRRAADPAHLPRPRRLIRPSHATLAERVDCHASTVWRALQAARELGLVRWAERRVRAAWRSLRTSNAVYADPARGGGRAAPGLPAHYHARAAEGREKQNKRLGKGSRTVLTRRRSCRTCWLCAGRRGRRGFTAARLSQISARGGERPDRSIGRRPAVSGLP